MSWDRSTMPGDVVLWAPRTVLGFSHDLAFKYGQIHVVCGSASDSEFGRCPTESDLSSSGGTGTTEIALRLVELRTGLRTEIRAVGNLQRAMSGYRCTLDYWDSVPRVLNSAFWYTCGIGRADQPLGTGIEMILPQREISRLVAGHWKATMRLNIKVDPAAPPVATATFNFDFTVTDYDAISIYFPGFDGIAPLVNMDLRYDPIRKMVGGQGSGHVPVRRRGLAERVPRRHRATAGHGPRPEGTSRSGTGTVAAMTPSASTTRSA